MNTHFVSRWLVSIAATVCATAAVSSDAHAQLAELDVYGTDLFDAEWVKANFDAELGAVMDARTRGDYQTVNQVEGEIIAALAEKGDFAFLELSAIRYFQRDPPYYVTIDVVEREDADRRMPFVESPQTVLEDPGGLFELWREYEQNLSALLEAGSLETGPCEVLHCLAAFGPNPELFPYLERFDVGARNHADSLYRSATEDVNDLHRAAAIYLLAHTGDLDRLLVTLGRAIYDSSSVVRNNAIRVIAELARQRPDLPYPAGDLIAAMDFPTAVDRNKAASAVALLAESPMHRNLIEATAVPIALRLLVLEQPNNHDPAYALLKAVSGEDFGPTNIQAWQSWYASR